MDILSLSSLELTAVLLTFCVIFVNGLTDAPNAVATCITTRCLSMRKAVFLSAIFNFIGVTVMMSLNASVAETITSMVDFGTDTERAGIALSASLFSIVLWAILAWYFGIPTSESHALISGLSGSAIALNGGIDGINTAEWLKAIYGLFTSCIGGFILGYLICKAVYVCFKNIKRRYTEKFFTLAEIFAAASMSFMHGAQDGQKFIAVLFMFGNFSADKTVRPIIILLCSTIMALGTLTGGKKIIKAVGSDMVRLEKYQGFSADLSASVSLLISTVFGFPVSTTHAKTTAIMGAGAAINIRSVNPSVIKNIVSAWLLTFPGCTVSGFFVTKLFLRIFL